MKAEAVIVTLRSDQVLDGVDGAAAGAAAPGGAAATGRAAAAGGGDEAGADIGSDFHFASFHVCAMCAIIRRLVLPPNSLSHSPQHLSPLPRF